MGALPSFVIPSINDTVPRRESSLRFRLARQTCTFIGAENGDKILSVCQVVSKCVTYFA